MISFKQFLIENEILEDDNAPKDGVTLYYGYLKDRKDYPDFVAVEYKDGELVNVFEKMGFNGVFPFDTKGRITSDAAKRSNQIIKSIEKMSGNSITKKVEMYLKRIYSGYGTVLNGATLHDLCAFVKGYFDTLVKKLQSLWNRHGREKYDEYMRYQCDLDESEDEQLEKEIQFIKKFIKKYIK